MCQGQVKEVTSTNGQDKHQLVSFKLLRDLKIKVTDLLFLISHKKERLKGVRRKAERGREGEVGGRKEREEESNPKRQAASKASPGRSSPRDGDAYGIPGISCSLPFSFPTAP